MKSAIVVLNVVIAILLAVLLAHLWKGPQRWHEVQKTVTDQKNAIQRLDEALRSMERQMVRLEEGRASQAELAAVIDRQMGLIERLTREGVVARPPRDPQAPPIEDAAPATIDKTDPALPPAGDGVPVLGRNFLLPYDGSHLDTAKIGGTFREFNATPPGLNDIIENAANTADINGLVNDSLCERDPVDPDTWHSQLAISCVIEDGWTKFTFTLRPGVRWQVPRLALVDPAFAWLKEPVELTAADFAFAIEMVKHPDVQCPALKAYYDKLDRVEIIDERRFVVYWSEAEYTNISFTMGLTPLPRHVYTRREDGTPLPPDDVGLLFNKHWFDAKFQLIGVGRYLLDDFAFDQHIVFRRNPDYWGAGLHFDVIRWDCATKDDLAQLVAFKNGQAHVHTLTPTQFKIDIVDHSEKRFAPIDPADPDASREGPLAWEQLIGNSYNYFGWNMRTELFRDKRVRWAMSHALPRDRLIDDIWHGLGRAQITNVHPDSTYFAEDLQPVAYDPAKARELLAQAGWRDSNNDGQLDRIIAGERKDFVFTIKYYANSAEWDNALAIYKDELRKLGIEMKLRPLEWPQLIQAYQDYDFDAVVGGWRMGGELDFMQLWHSKYADEPKSSNHCGFRNPEADRIAEEFRRTFDLPRRIQLARDFQRLIYEEQPYTFFRSSVFVLAWQNSGRERVAGVEYGLDRYQAFYKTNRGRWYLPGY